MIVALWAVPLGVLGAAAGSAARAPVEPTRPAPTSFPGRAAQAPTLQDAPAEVDVLGLDRPALPPRRRLVGPVQVRVRDDLVRRRRPQAVWSSVVWASLTRVASYPLTSAPWRVERTHASVCAPGDDEPPDLEVRQHGLQGGGLEGVVVALLDQRLGAARSQLGDDPPVVAAPREMLVGVLDPDDGDPFPPRLLDKAADVRDNRGALVRPRDDALLHVDDEERGGPAVLE